MHEVAETKLDTEPPSYEEIFHVDENGMIEDIR